MSDVTRLLQQASNGDNRAEDEVLRLVHEELRRIAAAKIAGETPGHTLQATALINEAYIRLLGKKTVDVKRMEAEAGEVRTKIHWDSRAHFFAAAAEAMRRILIDSARRKKRIKRGGNNKQVPLDDVEFENETPPVDLELLDRALVKLELASPDHAAVVKMRYFAGMTIEQTADALGVSPATVKRNWSYARAWLRRELDD